MDVRRALVQMDDEREDVLLTESAREDVVHVLRPFLDLRLPFDGAVVRPRREVHHLIAERQACQRIVRAADDEVHHGAVTPLVDASGVGVLDVARGEVLLEFLKYGFGMVHCLDLSAPDDLEVQGYPRPVYASVRVRALPAFLGPAALVLVALGRRESALRLEVQDLFL